jgi:hypothetical protein
MQIVAEPLESTVRRYQGYNDALLGWSPRFPDDAAYMLGYARAAAVRLAHTAAK